MRVRQVFHIPPKCICYLFSVNIKPSRNNAHTSHDAVNIDFVCDSLFDLRAIFVELFSRTVAELASDECEMSKAKERLIFLASKSKAVHNAIDEMRICIGMESQQFTDNLRETQKEMDNCLRESILLNEQIIESKMFTDLNVAQSNRCLKKFTYQSMLTETAVEMVTPSAVQVDMCLGVAGPSINVPSRLCTKLDTEPASLLYSIESKHTDTVVDREKFSRFRYVNVELIRAFIRGRYERKLAVKQLSKKKSKRSRK